MNDFCVCTDYKILNENNRELFRWHPPYGWIISWVELTTEKGYTQVHKYGITARFCPMCGKKVDNNV